MAARRMKALNDGSLASRVLDVLETDGGWLSVDYLIDRVGGKPASVQRAIWRLHTRGQVEHRRIVLSTGFKEFPDVRHEWRAT